MVNPIDPIERYLSKFLLQVWSVTKLTRTIVKLIDWFYWWDILFRIKVSEHVLFPRHVEGKFLLSVKTKLGIVLFWRSFAMCSAQKKLGYSLNLSNVKLTAKWILATRVFPRFLPIFALNSDWLLVVFTFQLIGCYDYVYFYLDLRHTLNRNAISAVFSSNRKKTIFEISIFHEIINLRPLLFKMREFEDMPDY